MADKPFDREVINQRERPLSSDINTGWSYGDKALRYLIDVAHRWQSVNSADPTGLTPLSGFIGDSFRVLPQSPAAMEVRITDGLGFLVDAAQNATDIGSGLTPGVLGVDDDQRMHPLPLSAEQTISVPAADPVNDRIDIVEVKLDRRLQDPTSRQVLDPSTGLFSALSVNKTLAFDLAGRTGVNTGGGNSTTGIAYKTGTPAGAPVAPATSAGYVKIAEVLVDAASTTVPQNKIKDVRPILAPDGVRRISLRASAPSSLNAQPDVLDVIGPPGIRACVLFVSGGAQVTQWWIFGGDLSGATVRANVSLQSNASTNPDTISFAEIHDVVTGNLTSGDITNLSTAHPSALSTILTVGQSYVRVDTYCSTIDNSGGGGATLVNAIGFSNPHVFHLDVAIR